MSFAVRDFVLKMINVYAVNLPTVSPMQSTSFRNLNGGKKKSSLRNSFQNPIRFKTNITGRDGPQTLYSNRVLELIIVISLDTEH